MFRKICQFCFAFVLCISASLVFADSSYSVRSIEVFTITGMPPQHLPAQAVLVELDAAGRLDALLSEQLPEDPEDAMRYMQNVMNSDQWQEISGQLKHAYTGLARAKQLGVEKVPAIVIDSEYVMYGVTNVEEALQLFERYHSDHRE